MLYCVHYCDSKVVHFLWLTPAVNLVRGEHFVVHCTIYAMEPTRARLLIKLIFCCMSVRCLYFVLSCTKQRLSTFAARSRLSCPLQPCARPHSADCVINHVIILTHIGRFWTAVIGSFAVTSLRSLFSSEKVFSLSGGSLRAIRRRPRSVSHRRPAKPHTQRASG